MEAAMPTTPAASSTTLAPTWPDVPYVSAKAAIDRDLKLLSKSDIQQIKQFLTTQEDTYRPAINFLALTREVQGEKA